MPLGVSPITADLLLSRSTVDRRAEMRTNELWLNDPATRDPNSARCIAVYQGNTPTDENSQIRFMSFLDAGSLPTAYLGSDADTNYFAIFADKEFVDQHDPDSWRNLRVLGAGLSAAHSGLLVAATALGNWHHTHPRCPRCGEPTEITSAGWTRTCPSDFSVHFPRTDPAVIMLVTDFDDRALLARQVHWQSGWMSVLAGFVESGESAEAAVVREVMEEVGVRVDPESIQYLGSQPWPFPNSLMLGYHARVAASPDYAAPGAPVPISVDGNEIAEARWFSRAELLHACASRDIHLPPRVSIAHHLITAWLGEPLPVETSFR